MTRERKKEQAYELLIRKRTDRACQKLAASWDAQTQVPLPFATCATEQWEQLLSGGRGVHALKTAQTERTV
jgi:hypothetical protein